MAAPHGLSRLMTGLAVVAAFLMLAALALRTGRVPTTGRPATPTVAERSSLPATAHTPISEFERASPPPKAESTATPTGSAPAPAIVFDLGTMQHPTHPAQRAGGDEFTTNERFTQDDLEHPERYFEAASRQPELNRVEEQRDALAFFESFRARLDQQLESSRDESERGRLRGIMDRYDSAIARLRERLGTDGPR